MRRPARLLAALVLSVAVPVAPAMAQTGALAEVADDLVLDGYHLASDAEPVDETALARTVAAAEHDVRVAVLGAGPPGGARSFADDLLQELGSGTIVVFTDEELQVSSSEFENPPVEDALDAADGQLDGSGDIPAYVAAFDAALGDAGPADGGAGGAGLGGVLLVGLLVVGLLVVLAGVVRSRGRRKAAAEHDRQAVGEARGEVAAQVAAVAERIVGLADRVTVADDPETSRLFAEATATYQATEAAVAGSSTPAALEAVADRLDHARWQLEAVAARLDGREPPPPPAREESCFFDPTHGAGTEQATLETPAGAREVAVCSSCAARLAAGETPEPRMVGVGGRQVPVAMAPRSYGGGGLGALGDVALVLGGRRTPYSWGGYGWGSPARGWGGAGWGGGGWGGGGGGGWGGRGRGGGGGLASGRSGQRSGGWGSGWSTGGGGRSPGRSAGGGGRSRSVRTGGGGRRRSGGGGGARRGGGGRRR